MDQENNKKKWIYTSLVFLVVVVLLYVGLGTNNKHNKKSDNEVDKEKIYRSDEEQKVASFIKTGDINACDKVDYVAKDGTKYKAVCNDNIALSNAFSTLDYTWCQKLVGQVSSVLDCQSQVMYGKLQKENDLTICNNVPDVSLKESCVVVYWSQEAYSKKDVSLCGNIININAQNGCKDSIYISQLIKNPNIFSCNNFSAGLKNDCENFKKAKLDPVKNFTLCFNILHPSIQSACER